MTNLILFVNSFLSYLLCFLLIVALVVVACIIGAKWRKSKDAKATAQLRQMRHSRQPYNHLGGESNVLSPV